MTREQTLDFPLHSKHTDNITMKTIGKLKLMTVVPTWEVTITTVFSRSDDNIGITDGSGDMCISNDVSSTIPNL